MSNQQNDILLDRTVELTAEDVLMALNNRYSDLEGIISKHDFYIAVLSQAIDGNVIADIYESEPEEK